MGILIIYILSIAFGMFTLWLATKILDLEINITQNAIVNIVPVLLGLIPGIGGLFSLIAFFGLLKYFTGEDIFPKIIFLAIVLWLLRFAIAYLLGLILGGLLVLAAG